jgi:hypothetical protein
MSIQVGGTIVVDNSRNLVNASAAGVTNVPVANATGTLSVSNGGTGASDASSALTALGGASTGKAIAMALVFGG